MHILQLSTQPHISTHTCPYSLGLPPPDRGLSASSAVKHKKHREMQLSSVRFSALCAIERACVRESQASGGDHYGQSSLADTLYTDHDIQELAGDKLATAVAMNVDELTQHIQVPNEIRYVLQPARAESESNASQQAYIHLLHTRVCACVCMYAVMVCIYLCCDGMYVCIYVCRHGCMYM